MIRVKITPMGGYVVGDGVCPFNPDEFLKLFGHKVMEGMAQGLTEIGFSDEEIAATVAAADNKFAAAVDAAPVRQFADDTTATQLLAADPQLVPAPQQLAIPDIIRGAIQE